MIKFFRNTHRDGEYKELDSDQKRAWRDGAFTCFLLSSDEGMTFDELYVKHQKFAEEYPEASYEVSTVLYNLYVLLRADLVRLEVT